MEHLTLESIPNGPNPAPTGYSKLYFDGTGLKLKIANADPVAIGSGGGGGVTEAQMNAAISAAVSAAISALIADPTTLASIIDASSISAIVDGQHVVGSVQLDTDHGIVTAFQESA